MGILMDEGWAYALPDLSVRVESGVAALRTHYFLRVRPAAPE